MARMNGSTRPRQYGHIAPKFKVPCPADRMRYGIDVALATEACAPNSHTESIHTGNPQAMAALKGGCI
jgi:hypothetical protein